MRWSRKVLRVQETLSANVIPMVDIMFLLVLFFMLAADMAQKERETVPLATAVSVEKEEQPSISGPEKRVILNLLHRSELVCGFYSPQHESRCVLLSHWEYRLRGEVYALDSVGLGMFEQCIRELGSPEQLPAMELMIRPDRSAPFLFVQKAIEICARVGIYKLQFGVEKKEG